MSLFGFNKRAKHRRFDYIPRYYDAQKEELQDRLTQYDDEKVDQTELAKRRIQSGLRTKYRVDASYKTQTRRKSNRNLFYIIVVLAVITYFVLASDRFIKILEGL